MNRKDLKKKAKVTINHHYFRNVIFLFICTILLSGGFNFNKESILEIDLVNERIGNIVNNKNLSNKEIINEILDKSEQKKKIEDKLNDIYYDGVLSVFFQEITSSGSLTFGLLNGINKLVFEEKVEIGVLIIISNILLFIITALFINVIEISKNRYFLEQRKYKDTKMDKLLFPYKIKKTLHLSYILFMKYLYEILWAFTIIGIFIKHYEYKMIPYILAENPSISRKEAFKLSKELTQGEKFNLFKLDLSFIGWEILNTLTLKISGIFYSNIYIETTYAEVYMHLRNTKKETLSNKELLNDELLNIETPIEEEYPEDKFSIQIDKTKRWYKLDYNKKYSLETFILLFFTFAFIGWCWEVFYHLINHGTFVNRGTMHGPWLPIYGWGGVLILFCLKKFRNSPFKLFLSAFILCGIVEYTTAWYLETFNHLKYWDYTGYFLNIHGRICLEGLLLFGIGGCAFTYILAPILDNIFEKIKPKIKTILCIILILFFSIDFIYSSIVPNTGKGISSVYKIDR